MWCQRLLRNRSRRYTIFRIYSLILWSVALRCAWNQTHKHNPCVVVLLDCFQSKFFNLMAPHGQRAFRTHFFHEFRVSAWYGQVIIFVFFQDVGKCDHTWQWLSKCDKRTSGFLGRCSGMLWEWDYFHGPLSVLVTLLFLVCHIIWFSSGDFCLHLRVGLNSDLHPPLSSSRGSRSVDRFSKQSTSALASEI